MTTLGVPPAPTHHTATFELSPGRHFAVGEATVKNDDGVAGGVVICTLFAGDAPIGEPVMQEVGTYTGTAGFGTLSFARTFEATSIGDLTVSFRCRSAGSASEMSHQYSNLTVFTVE